MKLKSVLKISFCLILIVCLLTPSVFGYVPFGCKWSDHRASIYYKSSVPSQYKTAMGNASSTWNQAGANFSYYNTSSASNANITVAFESTQQYPGIAAVTLRWLNASNRSQFDRCAITLNSSGNWTTNPGLIQFFENDVETVTLHEFGHTLGLNESYAIGSIMMTPPPFWTQRTLGNDDKNGVKYIYGVRSALKSIGLDSTLELNLNHEFNKSYGSTLNDKNLENFDDIVVITFTYQPISKEDLANNADLIVRGKVINVLPAYWNTDDGFAPSDKYGEESQKYEIYHDVVIEINEIYKGKTENKTVIFRQIGGAVDNTIRINLDSINYQKNDDVILYLYKDIENTKVSKSEFYFAYPVQGELLVLDNDTIVNSYGEKVDWVEREQYI
ncbi:matrixin family metalloprotease [Methanolapillus ohkumae]|uniref:Peptidase metallopeptidase domain-containing protein n=1 Tax=Methanolapillus ohkumae TaxID=3028298 RepID=A0AA96ZXZ3_9EURY|nr:hypothetical protein MsAm2_13940 [Methanosarcinaceae archaeon Am2]